MRILSRLGNLFERIRSFRKKKLRLGIAFGSGGAKGMAHLGVLKAFEEEGIAFDCVTGTSIGAIVGALYAKGYTSSDIVQIVENLNRREFSKNLRPFADLSFAKKYLQDYLEGDFSALSLPFAAWATDGDSGEGVLLDSGDVTSAVVASSAIPPFFKSVERDGKRLYDGAFTNAIPSDACRDLGAEFVVGIDLSAYSPPREEQSRFSRIFGAAAQKFTPVKRAPDHKTRGYDNADFMLRPALGDYRATDVGAEEMRRMYELGYDEARAHMRELREAIAEREKKR